MEKIQRNFLWGGSEFRRKIHYVKWETVKKPKKFGGLGVQGLIDKNLVLLAKWWWKLVTGKGGLWRRMIVDKYAIRGEHDPVNATVRSNRLSSTWKNIIKTVQANSDVASAFREGIKLKLGRGNDIAFWEDAWAGDKSFKVQYPKLHLLALDSQAKVGEMGHWIDGVWHWQLKFRRPLYQWEEAAKDELLAGLNHLQLKDGENDSIVWSYAADGIFSTNSLMKAAMSIKERKRKWVHVPFQLWSGVAPPKVELLVWKIYLDSLPSKMTLYRRKILKRDQNLACALCGIEQETTDHLLIHCDWSWRLWSCSLSWWGAVWVEPQSARSLLESWDIGGASKPYKKLWKTLCYAVLWSIWEERNMRCFQDKRRTAEAVGDLVKARVAWWAKFRSSKCPYTLSTIRRSIVEVRDNM